MVLEARRVTMRLTPNAWELAGSKGNRRRRVHAISLDWLGDDLLSDRPF
ncbi:MAG: hypothetical protein M2R45_03511 [Verrucomicrobia subdivision 3 bacterium]|nr:hypothetical protein [Limisphaerales bacterium]MCS1415907.1 hypothetical protein [Limisphaerales bacterium]